MPSIQEAFIALYNQSSKPGRAEFAPPPEPFGAGECPERLIVDPEPESEPSGAAGEMGEMGPVAPATLEVGAAMPDPLGCSAAARWPAESSGHSTNRPAPRRARFEPLPAVATRPPVLVPAMRVKTLRVPKVVLDVLGDCSGHWRELAVALHERSSDCGLRSVLVTASLRGEGATTVSIALAVALAASGDRRILLLDADFPAPALAQSLKLAARTGFEHVVLENAPLPKALVRSSKPPLDVLGMIHGFEHPGLIVANPRLFETMKTLREYYHLIVVDGGAVFSGRNPAPLLPGLDAALIVRQPTRSSEHLLDRLDAYLYENEISSLGIIENAVDES